MWYKNYFKFTYYNKIESLFSQVISRIKDLSPTYNIPDQIMSSLTTSTQGVAVSLLLCFSNSDVLKQIKRVFTSERRQRRLRPSVCSYHTTVSHCHSTNIQVRKASLKIDFGKKYSNVILDEQSKK